MPVTVVPIFDPNVITNTLCRDTIPTPHKGTYFVRNKFKRPIKI